MEREGLTLPTSGTQETHFSIKCNMRYYIIRNSYFLPERKNKIKASKETKTKIEAKL